MDAKDIRNLQEAYLGLYQELDEERAPVRKRGGVSAPEGERSIGGEENRRNKDYWASVEGRNRDRGAGSKAKRRAEALNKEDVDIYDIILSHLLDEGYADTQQSAEAIMVNMSEEWRESIVEAFHPVYGRGGEQRRTQTALQGLGKHARATDKKKLHNIPKGGTTISDRDPQGERLGTGEYDRGKGNKAKRRAASLKKEELDICD